MHLSAIQLVGCCFICFGWRYINIYSNMMCTVMFFFCVWFDCFAEYIFVLILPAYIIKCQYAFDTCVEVIGLNYRTIDKIDTNAIDKSQSISYLLLYLSEIDALFAWGGYVHCPFSGKWINQNRNLYASPTTAFNNKVLHHHYE